jgi:predicted AAA+ superfamily ATPase
MWTPSPGDYADILAEQNPWHAAGAVPDDLARDVERWLPQGISSALRRPVLDRYQVVVGPRRVGKTTGLYQAIRHLIRADIPARRIWWLRLDHPLFADIPLGVLMDMVRRRADAVPERPAFVFLDELTYAADWDRWLKTFYDERWPVRIAASSSSTAALRRRAHESGVGRWEQQYLGPYSFAEYLELIGQNVPLVAAETLNQTLLENQSRAHSLNLAAPRQRYLLTGGFPELLLALRDESISDDAVLRQSQHTLRADAVQRAIYQDIPQAFRIEDPRTLERMLYTLAGQITGLLSPQSLARETGVAQPTFDRYLSYLEQSFLVFTLPNYSSSEATVQRRGRKLYFVDGAVRNAALQRGLGPLRDPAEQGILLENMAAAHLHMLGEHSQVRVYHWREGEREVDLVYDHPDNPAAFEITGSKRHSREGLRVFAKQFPRFQGRCYVVSPGGAYVSPQDDPDGIGALSLDYFLLAVSSQAARAANERLLSPLS